MKRNKEDQLIPFFGITFAFSWLLWLPALLRSNGYPELPAFVGILSMLAPFGPAVAAFWLTWRRSGKAGAKALWLRGWRLDFEKKWLVPAILLGPITALLAAALTTLLGGEIPWGSILPALFIVPVFLLIYFTQALPEEYGWRGFALGPLQRRFNALTASLLLGVIWAIWHLPLFFIEGTTQQVIPLYQFILQTMVLAVFYTWLYNNTGGSVLIVALLHGVGNTASAVIPFWTTELGRWLDFGVLIGFAGIVVWHWGWRRLSRDAVAPNRAEPLA